MQTIRSTPKASSACIPGTIVVILGVPLLVVAYDLWSTPRLQRATIVGTALIFALPVTIFPFYFTTIVKGIDALTSAPLTAMVPW